MSYIPPRQIQSEQHGPRESDRHLSLDLHDLARCDLHVDMQTGTVRTAKHETVLYSQDGGIGRMSIPDCAIANWKGMSVGDRPVIYIEKRGIFYCSLLWSGHVQRDLNIELTDTSIDTSSDTVKTTVQRNDGYLVLTGYPSSELSKASVSHSLSILMMMRDPHESQQQ